MEKNEELYQKSDKSLKGVKTILIVMTWILAFSYIVLGISFWRRNEAVLGVVFFFGGPFLSVVGYYLGKFFLWIAFDIKVIRTAVTTKKMSDELQSF